MIDVATLTERRRPLDRLESRIAELYLAKPDADAIRVADTLRYVVSFARLTTVRNRDGADVDVMTRLDLHAQYVFDELSPRLDAASSLWEAARALPELVRRTRNQRGSLLEHVPVDRDSLEREITTKNLLVASGGGGGAGYVYPGVYEELERAGLIPDLMAGTSIGALMSIFRARRRRYDAAPMVAAGRSLAWSNVFRVLESDSHYGLPAALRLYLRAAVGGLFRGAENRPVTMADMEIPLIVMATGITVDALKHDLHYYEHLLDAETRGGSARSKVSGIVKAITLLREFLSRPDALVEVAIGHTQGTADFDVLDAAGFSASIPAVIHYDVLRDDAHMKRLLDELYMRMGITRLGEGGMVANVPARTAWEATMGGRLGRRNSFVLALDCFAPNPRTLAWYPLQQAVRSANVERDRHWADAYVPFSKTLSPMNLVPPVRDFLEAMRWGRETIRPYLPKVREMMRPIAVLADG